MSEHTINDISPIYTMPADEQKSSVALMQIPDLITATGGECDWILQKGANSGLECGKRCILDTPRCKAHYDKEAPELPPKLEVTIHTPLVDIDEGIEEFVAEIKLDPVKPKITFKVVGNLILIEVGEHKFEFS